MERHGELAAGRDLRERVARLVEDGLGAGLDVVVAGPERLAHRVLSVAAEARRVLLERAAARAVPRRGGVDAERHARSAGVTGGGDDGAVACHETCSEKDGGD